MPTSRLYARNPLAEARQSDPFDRSVMRSAERAAKRPAPGLFATGDLPPVTASGNPPHRLLELPWTLRHAAAEADQATFARLMSEYGRGVADVDVALLYEPLAQHPGNYDYQARFAEWVQTV